MMHAYTLFIYRHKYVYVYIEQGARLSPFVDDTDAFPGIYILHSLYMIHVFTLCIYIYICIYRAERAAYALHR